MKEAFHKISVEFEYSNEIYDINSEPYNTLSELKEIISKKIFPHPGDVHCFYKNFDLYEKEDEEISKIFPNKTKIKIILKNPPVVKPLKKLKINHNNQLKLNLFDSYPNIPTTIESPIRLPRSKTIVNKNQLKFNSLPSMTIDKTESNQNYNMNRNNNKIIDQEINENIKSNDFIYDLFNSSKKKLEKLKKDESGIKNFMDKFKSTKMKNSSLSDKKLVNDINILLSNMKEKGLFSYKQNNNNIKLASPKNLFLNKRADKIFKTQKKNLLNSNLKLLNLSTENKESNQENNLNNNTNNNKEKINSENKKTIDENYLCNSCKNEMISEYCLKCNEFKCNSCIELCKVDEHEHIEIKLDNDCFNIVNSYGLLILSKINKKNEQILENDKELQIYDIKKFRDDFILLINDVLCIYNQIMSILENIYKENPIKKELNKFENESNKIKIEINDIIKKANVYLKNDNQISKPKYKMMNIQYFFDSLNTKQNSYNTLTNKLQVYFLDSTINSNMKKCFNEIEDLMKAFTNKTNPFKLKDEDKIEYEKLISNFNKNKKDKRRMYKKRNSMSVKTDRRLNLKKFSTEKNEDIDEDEYLDV